LVVPLIDNVYNRCKSNIKFLEVSSAKKVGVWQKIHQYEEVIDDKNGFLANTAQEWFDSIKKLVEDTKLRKTMGENAYKTVKRDWTIQGNIDRYAKFFKDILDNP